MRATYLSRKGSSPPSLLQSLSCNSSIFIHTSQEKSILTSLEPEPLGYCEFYPLHLNSHQHFNMKESRQLQCSIFTNRTQAVLIYSLTSHGMADPCTLPHSHFSKDTFTKENFSMSVIRVQCRITNLHTLCLHFQPCKLQQPIACSVLDTTNQVLQTQFCPRKPKQS